MQKVSLDDYATLFDHRFRIELRDICKAERRAARSFGMSDIEWARHCAKQYMEGNFEVKKRP